MYLVFDVGGTFVKYAWMSVDGDIQEKGKIPNPDQGRRICTRIRGISRTDL